jgi:hypothetical protein
VKYSDELFQLIRSLEASEKRYFKIHATQHIVGEKNNYLDLFEAIDKQAKSGKGYDEDKLLQKFKGEKFTKNFAVAKGYLVNSILKSLKAYHAGRTIDSQVRELLDSVEILYNKGLFKHAGKLVLKAKKLALSNDKTISYLEVESWEKFILHAQADLKGIEKYLEESFSEETFKAEQYQHEIASSGLILQMYVLVRSKGFVRHADHQKSFEEILNHSLFYLNEAELSFQTQSNLLTIQVMYHNVQSEWKESYKNHVKIVELWETHPERILERPMPFLHALNNWAISCYRVGKVDELFNVLDRLKAFPGDRKINLSLYLQGRIFGNVYNSVLHYNLLFGEFEATKILEAEVKEGLKKYSNILSELEESSFYFNLGALNFGLGKYSEALKWFNQLLNVSEYKPQEDLVSFSRIFLLLIHLELKNYDLLKYMVKSVDRFLTNRNRKYGIEQNILAFIRKLYLIKSDEQLVAAYAELCKAVTETVNDPFEDIVLKQYFDFVSWFESRVEDRDFIEIVQAKRGIQKLRQAAS